DATRVASGPARDHLRYRAEQTPNPLPKAPRITTEMVMISHNCEARTSPTQGRRCGGWRKRRFALSSGEMAKDRDVSPDRKQTKSTGDKHPAGKGSGSKPRADRPRKGHRKKRAAVEESPPVLSGRLMIATIILAAMAMIRFMGIGRALEPDSPVPTDTGAWEVGKSATVHVTLITADYNKLSCYSKQTFKGHHCQFETETQAFRRDPNAPIDDNKKTLVQPYRTHGSNKLIFISGLWATPALATRLHFEPPRGVAEKNLARFVAECEVE